MESNKGHIEALDIARSFAIVSVVYIHSSCLYLCEYDNSRLELGLFASRFAVPLFILISGYLHKIRSKGMLITDYYRKFTRNRINRILIPYFLFSFMYMAVRILMEQSLLFDGMVPTKYDSFSKVISAIFLFQDNPAGHLYFLPLLFLTSILFCVVSEFIKNIDTLVFICLSVSIIIYSLHGGIYLSLNPMKGIGFYALGHYVRRRLHDKGKTGTTFSLFTAAFVCYLSAVIFVNEIGNLGTATKFSIIFIYHLMGALFIFQVSFYISKMTRFEKPTAILRFIGKYSYTIFLWHEPYVVSVLYILLVKLSIDNPLLNQTLLMLTGIFTPIILFRFFIEPASSLIEKRSFLKPAI